MRALPYRYLSPALLLLFFTLAFPARAHAYIDPGAGSMLVQILIAGFAGIGVLCKLGWQRLFGRTRRKSSADTKTEPSESE